MPRPRRVVFLTGTRADFGKIKSLIRKLCEEPEHFHVQVFATGMHVDPKYGSTVNEIKKCAFPNVEIETFDNEVAAGRMDRTLANTVVGFSNFVRRIEPDMIVVHGDRVEALAGALVGSLNNIFVAHIEGGEVSGTIDEHIRHSVSKMAHFHFVSNDEAARRLEQLGEPAANIHVIGSPDLDILSSPDLPTLEEVKAHYEIPFEQYGVLVLHPVTTNLNTLREETRALLRAVKRSGKQFVAIYPNSDQGSNVILEEYEKELRGDPNVRLFPSVRFEAMLVLLRHAEFVLGNSSMGIHEAPFYGTPTINVGTRQQGRSHNAKILHVPGEEEAISAAIVEAGRRGHLKPVHEFGGGNSDKRFREVLENPALWNTSVQKRFCDLPQRFLTHAA